MTRRRVLDVTLGLVLAAVSFLGVLYGVNESAAQGEDGGAGGVPQLICPLH